MKKTLRNVKPVCLAVLLAIGLILTGCSDWLNNEKAPEITIDWFPFVINIETERELGDNIAIVKVFSFDEPCLDENEDDLIALSPSRYYCQENGKYLLDIPDIVHDEKLKKLSDVCDKGAISNPAAKVACLQYFRAYSEEEKYIGYFEYSWYSHDEENGVNIQIWFADSDVSYTSDNGKIILSLQKGWNYVYEGYDEEKIGDLYNKGFRPKWRFTEL